MQKIEFEKNDIIDKKEKIFSQEVENLKLQYFEEKEQLQESINKLSEGKEEAIQENLKLRDQILSDRFEERKEFILLKEQMNAEKMESTRELENKIKCISEVKLEIDERLKKQSVRLNDTLEDKMRLKVEIEKLELKQSEMDQLLQQRDFDIKSAVSGMEQKLLKKEEEILIKNNKLHSTTKQMESDHKNWNGLEKKLRSEIKELKSTLKNSNARLKEKDETLKRMRYT